MLRLTLEYTDNIDIDIHPMLARLHEEVVVTGAINLKGIKSGTIKHTQYRIADGDPNYSFVHVGLLTREGRPTEIQRDATQRVVLKETFGYLFETRKLSLTVDIKEMHNGIALTEHNIPAK